MLNEWNSILPGDDVTGPELEAHIRYLEDGKWEGVYEPEDVADELASLRAFAADLKILGKPLENLIIVSADEWAGYAEENFDDIYGNIPDEYINHDQYADDLRSAYTTIEWEGHDYYVR